MKLQVSGVFQILNIKRNDVCADGREWCQGSLLNFFEADEKEYIYFSAFGNNATFIMDHHTGSNSRRAFITGLLETEIIVEKVKVNIKGEPVILKRNKTIYKMVIDSIRFLDKNKHADEINTIDETDYDDCAVVDITEATETSVSSDVVSEGTSLNIKSRNNKVTFDEVPDDDISDGIIKGGRNFNRNKRK